MSRPRARLLTALCAAAALVTATVAPAAASSSTPAFVEGDTSNPVTAAPPVTTPATRHCTVTLADGFASNTIDGAPQDYSGTLTPPAACAGPWTKVVLTQTVTVSGRQYDRVGTLTVGDAEIYHGTTAEPGGPDPTTYTFGKDVTEYTALLRTAHPFRGGIVNYVSGVYTGVYLQTVSLTYYVADRTHPAPHVPDVVVGLGDTALSPTAPTADLPLTGLPRNITGGYLETTLEGSGCDEQWFSAVPDQVAARYPSAGLCGHGPYREADVSLDGHPVAGVHTFPHVYSGGIVPTLWRPVPAIGTFDLHSETVDITPFAGTLVDGRAHRIGLGLQDIGDGWTVTATLFLYTDPLWARTSGGLVTDHVARTAPVTTRDTDVSGGVRAAVTAARDDTTSGWVDTSAGRVWTTVHRTVDYRNVDTVTGGGLVQAIRQSDRGTQTVVTTRDGFTSWQRHDYDYPLSIDFSAAQYDDDQDFSLSATVRMGRSISDSGARGTRRSTETVASTGELTRSAGTTTQSDGSSLSTFLGTDDAGHGYLRRIVTSHGVVQSDVVRRGP